MKKLKSIICALLLLVPLTMLAACGGGIPKNGEYELYSARYYEAYKDNNLDAWVFGQRNDLENTSFDAEAKLKMDGKKFYLTLGTAEPLTFTYKSPTSKQKKNHPLLKAIPDAQVFTHGIAAAPETGYIFKGSVLVFEGDTPIQKDAVIVAFRDLDTGKYETYTFLIG